MLVTHPLDSLLACLWISLASAVKTTLFLAWFRPIPHLVQLPDDQWLQCLRDWPAASVVRLANVACDSDGLVQ